MEASAATAEAGTGITGSTELARNALGLPQILFCIVTGSAPLAAMMFNDPLSGYGIGIAVPAAYWLATFCFFFFSIPYVEMARRVTTAGGMYSYMTYGFGRVIGLGTAVAIAAAYMLFVPGIVGAGGFFAHESILDLSGGFDMDWRIYTYCFIVLIFIFSYFHVESVAKLLGFCLIGELIVLTIFSFSVVVKGGGPDGILWEALNPAALFNGGAGIEGAARVFGVGLAGIGFFFAFWSWVGFEMAPNYAEESRNPKKMMAAAIYISCLGLGLFYTFWAWMLVTAYGSTGDAWVWGVATSFGVTGAPAGVIPDPATHNYAIVFYPVVQDFAGVGVKNLFQVLIITGIFACCLAFWNTSCRYLFAMGREGILPRVVGRTHAKHKSPFIAAILMLIFTLAVYSIFAFGPAASGTLDTLGLQRSDALVGFSIVATWLPFQGNMILFPIMALVCLAIMVYFIFYARDGFHWFKTGVAPIIGAGSMSFAVYLMLKNRVGITFSTDYSGWIKAVPYYSLGIFLIGVIMAIGYKYWSKERYEAVGKFVHEEA